MPPPPKHLGLGLKETNRSLRDAKHSSKFNVDVHKNVHPGSSGGLTDTFTDPIVRGSISTLVVRRRTFPHHKNALFRQGTNALDPAHSPPASRDASNSTCRDTLTANRPFPALNSSTYTSDKTEGAVPGKSNKLDPQEKRQKDVIACTLGRFFFLKGAPRPRAVGLDRSRAHRIKRRKISSHASPHPRTLSACS